MTPPDPDKTRTTGDEPLSGIDPGGTRPTRPGPTKERVETGDRNDMTKENPATDPEHARGAS